MTLDPNDIDLAGLAPERRNGISLFPDPNLGLLKIDIAFEAGAAHQPKPLVAGAANNLLAKGTARRSAQEIAEYIDYRGAEWSVAADSTGAQLSLYTLPRYAAELAPLLKELTTEATYPEEEVEIYLAKRRQELQANLQKTSYMARLLFFRALFPAPHPYGLYATPEDADKVTAQDVRAFHRQRYRWEEARITLSGACREALQAMQSWLPAATPASAPPRFPCAPATPQTLRHAMPQAVQSTLRMGRRLPFAPNDPRHALFLVLNAVLGGYFGSRLMSNLREDKGYTYGIYSRVQLLRDASVFSLSADVNAEVADDALHQVRHELRRLREDPIPEEELERVRNYLVGDFLRGIDGVFERSERLYHQENACLDDTLDANYLRALATATPKQLQELAAATLQEADLTTVVAGQ